MTPRLETLFAIQARRTPQAPAVLHAGACLTYAALDASAEQIAERLRRLGAGPGTLAAVCLRRTPLMIAALLGVLKTGAAYLPLDPAYPSERLGYMLADSGAAALLTDNDVGLRLAYDGLVVDLRTPAEADPAPVPLRRDAPRDLAYVLYTSGSTGLPKGVMLGHTAVNLVKWARSTLSCLATASTVMPSSK